MQSNTKSLLSIPSTDIRKVVHLVESYSDHDTLDLLKHNDFNKRVKRADLDLKNVMIMIAEPSQRLINAYNAAKKQAPEQYTSFRDFYTNPVRKNFYSNLFSGLDISEVGVVGLQAHFYKTILVMSDWLGCRLYRLPYNNISEQTPKVSISSKEKAEIEALHCKDYALYRKAKDCFEQRWRAYQHLHCLSSNKNIKVHLGPPKTGTSTIQAWLSAHKEQLVGEGVYYPQHSSDKNGVSSGNFERLISAEPRAFSATDKRKASSYFDDDKAKALITKFEKSDCNTLLLSSEHFYYYLIWLFSRLPKSEFIFYVRHPLAIMESSFNQEVKRHKRKEDFFIPASVGFNNLILTKSLAKEFGINITYRYFDDNQFIGGHLLSDFASTVGINSLTPKNVARLNTSYSPGAISLMMKVNAFASDSLRRELDMFLQKDSESVSAFSFIKTEKFEEIQNKILAQAELLTQDDNNLSAKAMTSLIRNYGKPPTVTESQRQKDLIRVTNTLFQKEPLLARKLRKESRQHSHNANALEIYEYFKKDWKAALSALCKRVFRIKG